jgi:hypothetical protein
MSGFAGLAVDHRIVEGGNVTGGFPNAWVHENSRINTDIGWGFLDEPLPPHIADVTFDFRA